MSLLTSWVPGANDPAGPFPLNNLPYGVFSTDRLTPRCGMAIGDMILDMRRAEETGLLALPADSALFDAPAWNKVMEHGPTTWAALRDQLQTLLAEGAPQSAAPCLVPRANARLHMPMKVSEYTDFYAGRQHAENMGAILRGSPSLPDNWLHIPIGYNGRASSVVVSGTPIRRPLGQIKTPDADLPSFGPSTRLDIELELGAIVGTGCAMGTPITTDQADDMIFGYVLLNDWSARDIQAWEYHPLGPFQSKAFATSISPWIVPKAALDPFRTTAPTRSAKLLPYLKEHRPNHYNIELQVLMTPKGADRPTLLTRTNANRLYYSAAQQITHHALSGCGMRSADLLGSGTISGPTKSEYGSLMELSWNGQTPFPLDTGETRSFIEDGDTLTLRGMARGDGYTIGFADCTGTILPAPAAPA